MERPPVVTCVFYREHTLHATSIQSDFRSRTSILEPSCPTRWNMPFPAGDESDGRQRRVGHWIYKVEKVPLN
ncbi:hypothetical protein J4Q44_G00386750 [Coregonus suidteri]|uniref:Uncharacterized protein n=1 Tax=Coregonus suidteri TaxID=861788 RepID=A0AAN8Q432_9TELE